MTFPATREFHEKMNSAALYPVAHNYFLGNSFLGNLRPRKINDGCGCRNSPGQVALHKVLTPREKINDEIHLLQLTVRFIFIRQPDIATSGISNINHRHAVAIVAKILYQLFTKFPTTKNGY